MNNGAPTGLYVGASSVVNLANQAYLQSCQINAILNVAFDCDDNPSQFSGSPFEFAKVGLVDTGPSPGKPLINQAEAMIAAVSMLDQLQTRCGGESGGNVLVHCISGGSRSVAVAALWMAQRLPISPQPGQTRFMTAIDLVRKARGFGSAPYDPTDPDAPNYPDGKPMAALFYLAQAIDETVTMFPSKLLL